MAMQPPSNGCHYPPHSHPTHPASFELCFVVFQKQTTQASLLSAVVLEDNVWSLKKSAGLLIFELLNQHSIDCFISDFL